MIASIFNKSDATIYERYPNENTGLDAILEINKDIVDSINYNSRILLNFTLSDLNDLMTATQQASASYYLKLTAANTAEIPLDYSLYVYPVSQSWTMGTGRFGLVPSASDGVSWKYRNGTTGTIPWTTSSFATNSTGNWVTTAGGGTWYTSASYVSSQSFNYQLADLSVDVTNTVRAWLSGTLNNDGFIIKRSYADELSVTPLGSIKFFSKDTHTIYQPRLEVRWNDSTNTGTYPSVSFDDQVLINVPNLQSQYQQNSKVRINIVARPKYPTFTFTTQSNYLDIYQLPVSSSYSILDAASDEVIIPFDYDYTKISSDTKGNYFRLYMNGLEPERYYRIAIKTKPSDVEEYVLDNNWIFKVTR